MRTRRGGGYRAYFSHADEYWITNYENDPDTLKATDGVNCVSLNLELDLLPELHGRFDVVFNHTTLEHVFDVHRAFRNLCLLSKDVVILVVPFLQQQHYTGAYGDFWRFSPMCVKRLFELNEMQLAYLNFNETPNSSVYIFAIGIRNADKWKAILEMDGNRRLEMGQHHAGEKAIKRPLYLRILYRMLGMF